MGDNEQIIYVTASKSIDELLNEKNATADKENWLEAVDEHKNKFFLSHHYFDGLNENQQKTLFYPFFLKK